MLKQTSLPFCALNLDIYGSWLLEKMCIYMQISCIVIVACYVKEYNRGNIWWGHCQCILCKCKQELCFWSTLDVWLCSRDVKDVNMKLLQTSLDFWPENGDSALQCTEKISTKTQHRNRTAKTFHCTLESTLQQFIWLLLQDHEILGKYVTWRRKRAKTVFLIIYTSWKIS